MKTASGAVAVQIVHSNRRGSRNIEHVGSAHSPAEVEVLKAAARQRLHAGQDTLDFGDGRPAAEALPITATQSKHLWDALCGAYDRLGLDAATGGDEVFRALVLARLVEPTSKLDAIRVLTDLGLGNYEGLEKVGSSRRRLEIQGHSMVQDVRHTKVAGT